MQAGRDAEIDMEMCEATTDGPWFVRARNGDFARIADGVVLAAGMNDTRFVTEARAALPHWIQRAQAAEEALRWYADQNNYSIPHLGCAPKIMADQGKRAHDILKDLGIEVGK